MNEKKLLSKLCVGDLSFGVALSLAFRFIAAVSWSAVRCSAVEVQEFGYRDAGGVVLGLSTIAGGGVSVASGDVCGAKYDGRRSGVLEAQGSPLRHSHGPQRFWCPRICKPRAGTNLE